MPDKPDTLVTPSRIHAHRWLFFRLDDCGNRISYHKPAWGEGAESRGTVLPRNHIEMDGE